MHRGFSAPVSSPGAREEESLNYEAGVRAALGFADIDVTAFRTDYDNLLGICTLSSSVTCEVGDAFNGDVSAGDPIPYIPEHELFVSVGIERSRFGVFLNASYTDEVCVRASCGPFETTDSALVLDSTAHLRVSEELTLYAQVENLTGEDAIVGRQPYGARPNKERTAGVGVRMTF